MELLPRQQIVFQRMMDTIRRGFELYGFLPIETPVFEVSDVLLSKSGGETEKQVYFVQSTGGLEQGHKPGLALRFDLTVPLARYVAEHEADLAFPFRRYQIQRVYRGERAQRGRYREFYQCDIDVIGKDTLPLAFDAEIPAVIHTLFSELEVGPSGSTSTTGRCCRGCSRAWASRSRSGGWRCCGRWTGWTRPAPDGVRDLLMGGELGAGRRPGRPDPRTGWDPWLGGRCAGAPGGHGRPGRGQPGVRPGRAGTGRSGGGTEGLRVPESHWSINLGIARGLDYYTGTVYETFLTDHPGMGSVCSGGRYDNLASQYTKSRLPGVGISIGLTRLFYVLSEAGLAAPGPSTVQGAGDPVRPGPAARVPGPGGGPRNHGVNTDIHLEPAKIGRQFKYADRAGIPFAVVMGPDEMARGVATVKDLRTGAQVRMPRGELAGYFQGREWAGLRWLHPANGRIRAANRRSQDGR